MTIFHLLKEEEYPYVLMACLLGMESKRTLVTGIQTITLEPCSKDARVAQWLSVCLQLRSDSGVPGSSLTSGSLHGACFSYHLYLCLSLCVSHE